MPAKPDSSIALPAVMGTLNVRNKSNVFSADATRVSSEIMQASHWGEPDEESIGPVFACGQCMCVHTHICMCVCTHVCAMYK
jgi:hypothetical protein